MSSRALLTSSGTSTGAWNPEKELKVGRHEVDVHAVDRVWNPEKELKDKSVWRGRSIKCGLVESGEGIERSVHRR